MMISKLTNFLLSIIFICFLVLVAFAVKSELQPKIEPETKLEMKYFPEQHTACFYTKYAIECIYLWDELPR